MKWFVMLGLVMGVCRGGNPSDILADLAILAMRLPPEQQKNDITEANLARDAWLKQLETDLTAGQSVNVSDAGRTPENLAQAVGEKIREDMYLSQILEYPKDYFGRKASDLQGEAKRTEQALGPVQKISHFLVTPTTSLPASTLVDIPKSDVLLQISSKPGFVAIGKTTLLITRHLKPDNQMDYEITVLECDLYQHQRRQYFDKIYTELQNIGITIDTERLRDKIMLAPRIVKNEASLVLEPKPQSTRADPSAGIGLYTLLDIWNGEQKSSQVGLQYSKTLERYVIVANTLQDVLDQIKSQVGFLKSKPEISLNCVYFYVFVKDTMCIFRYRYQVDTKTFHLVDGISQKAHFNSGEIMRFRQNMETLELTKQSRLYTSGLPAAPARATPQGQAPAATLQQAGVVPGVRRSGQVLAAGAAGAAGTPAVVPGQVPQSIGTAVAPQPPYILLGDGTVMEHSTRRLLYLNLAQPLKVRLLNIWQAINLDTAAATLTQDKSLIVRQGGEKRMLRLEQDQWVTFTPESNVTNPPPGQLIQLSPPHRNT